MKRISFWFLMILVSINSFMSAQVTTSSLSGKVTDNLNAPITGATVKATHSPLLHVEW